MTAACAIWYAFLAKARTTRIWCPFREHTISSTLVTMGSLQQLHPLIIFSHETFENRCICHLHLACIFSSSLVASADHVYRDVSIEGVAAVTSRSGDNGHWNCPEPYWDLISPQTMVAPSRHPTHVALHHTCSLSGKRRQRHKSVQDHRGPQLEKRSEDSDVKKKLK